MLLFLFNLVLAYDAKASSYTNTNISAGWNETSSGWNAPSGSLWDNLNGTNNSAVFTNGISTITISTNLWVNGISYLNSANKYIVLSGSSRTLNFGGSTPFIFVTNNANISIQVNLAGGVITKTGGGTLTLASGTNTHKGFVVSAGELKINPGNTNALGGENASLEIQGGTLNNAVGAAPQFVRVGSVILGNGTITGTGGLYFTNFLATNTGDAAVITFSRLTGPGALTKRGSGNLTIYSSNSYTGGNFINEGLLTLSNAYALGVSTNTLTISGGAIDLGPLNVSLGVVSVGGGTISGLGTLTASGFMATNNGAAEIAAAISGTGGFNKSAGIGTITLSGQLLYSGTTKVASGGLLIGTDGSADYIVGSAAGQSQNLQLTGGFFHDYNATIGQGSRTYGIATVSGGTWSNDGVLTIGSLGVGTLSITGGVVGSGGGSIGDGAGSSGLVTVGTGGTWNNGGDLTVGSSGSGTLTITGGTVSNAGGSLGVNAGATGIVTVSNGSWNNDGVLTIGSLGVGTLSITGGVVGSVGGSIGDGAGSSGLVTVGTGGTWNSSDDLTVGASGSGTLTINGGSVSNAFGYIAVGSGSSGQVTVGAGGTWSNGGDLVVASSGNGTLLIGSGLVSNTAASIADNSGAVGSVTVGPGGIWNNGGNLSVGSFGTGSLIITNGFVSSIGGFIGGDVGATGNVSINGGAWNIMGDLVVGSYGNGTLVIRNGTVTNAFGVIADNSGSVGSVAVGEGGCWSNTGDLMVGSSGSGSLTIKGGTVSNGLGYIAFDTGSVGSVTVGAQGSWNNSGDLVIGYLGVGSLTIAGGIVSNAAASIADNAGSSASVTVGSGGIWNNGGNLSVGSSGTGSLIISNGSVSSVGGLIGDDVGAIGSVAISGGAWNILGDLVVGSYGNGTLTVGNSGTVTVGGGSGSLVIASNDFSVGIISIGSTGDRGLSGSINVSSVYFGSGKGMINFQQTDSMTFSASLHGNGSLNLLGAGTVTLTGNNSSFSGDISIVSGSALRICNGMGESNCLGASTISNEGVLDLNLSEAMEISAVTSGKGVLLQRGPAMVTMTGSNTFSGQITVDNSALNLGTTGSFLNSLITVQNGGTLLLGASTAGQINNLTLNHGALSLGGNGVSRASQSLGTLTLTGNSSIDFSSLGGNTSSLAFKSIEIGGYELQVFNYTAGSTHLYDYALSDGIKPNLNQVSFYSGSVTGSGFLGVGGIAVNGYEIIPIPEPSVVITSVFLMFTAVFSNFFIRIRRVESHSSPGVDDVSGAPPVIKRI